MLIFSCYLFFEILIPKFHLFWNWSSRTAHSLEITINCNKRATKASDHSKTVSAPTSDTVQWWILKKPVSELLAKEFGTRKWQTTLPRHNSWNYSPTNLCTGQQNNGPCSMQWSQCDVQMLSAIKWHNESIALEWNWQSIMGLFLFLTCLSALLHPRHYTLVSTWGIIYHSLLTKQFPPYNQCTYLSKQLNIRDPAGRNCNSNHCNPSCNLNNFERRIDSYTVQMQYNVQAPRRPHYIEIQHIPHFFNPCICLWVKGACLLNW